MEQHPVPQNVTTFQFRLIGDMTIKQFGYLAGGAILAYIFYKLPLPFFISWPLSVICALGGFGFAFIPIEERPMDIWVLSFFRSVYSPTQYVWQKSKPAPEPVTSQAQTARAVSTPAAPSVPPPPPTRPAVPQTAPSPPKPPSTTVLSQLFGSPKKPKPEEGPKPAAPPPPTKSAPVVVNQQKSGGLFSWFLTLFASKPKKQEAQKPAPQKPPMPSYVPRIDVTPVPSVTGRRVDIPPPVATPPASLRESAASEIAKKRATELEEKLRKLQDELKNKSVTEDRILELQRQLTDVLAQKGKLEVELTAIRQKLEAKPEPPKRVLAPEMMSAPAQPTVKVITPDVAVKAGLPKLTTVPNVVTGIIRDFERSLLPGVLVTVRDKDDIPLRALKSNKLGQFAASTPLSNGVYIVEIEDPRGRYVFDRVQVTLNGSVMPAIEIVAKNQKQLAREKLAKELFGDKPA